MKHRADPQHQLCMGGVGRQWGRVAHISLPWLGPLVLMEGYRNSLNSLQYLLPRMRMSVPAPLIVLGTCALVPPLQPCLLLLVGPQALLLSDS